MLPSKRFLLAVVAFAVVASGTAWVAWPGPATEEAPGPASNESGPTSTATPDEPSPRSVEVPPPPANGSSLEHRAAVFRTLRDGNASPGPEERRAMLDRLNGTFEGYVDMNRTGEPPFETDAALVGQFPNGSNVTRGLVGGDAILARQAILDARRVSIALDNRSIDYDRGRVVRKLRDAREAFLRAGRGSETSPACAVVLYGHAWTDAQSAIDVMDRAVTPNVTIDDRSDPWDDRAAARQVTGTVFAVRPAELEVTARTHGDSLELYTDRRTAPGSPLRYVTAVEFDGGATEVTIEASDPGTPTRQYPEPPAPANESACGDDVAAAPAGPAGDGDDARSGWATLELDGDGLPDAYEVEVTGTDPLDPDSASNRTDANEAGNGIVDGEEDFDRDRIATVGELELGTDPLAADSDDDGLDDLYELRYADTDPSAADSDGDRTPDGAEDPDDDGLTNAEEAGVSEPTFADSDSDGLDDSAELDNSTDPMEPDTDGDGLEDGAELDPSFGTDPLDPDTDDDGVPDGNETYRSTVRHEETGSRVAVTGRGDVASRLEIETIPQETRSDHRLSPIISVRTDATFERARITIPVYDDVDLADADAVAILAWNADADQFWLPVGAEIDEDRGTVSARVESFGYYVVVDQRKWGGGTWDSIA